MAIAPQRLPIRRRLRPGDGEAIAELHRRVYVHEYGLNTAFVDSIVPTVRAATETGWPERGGVWLIDRDADLLGSLALTEEAPGVGRVRWFALDAALRGQGCGRVLLDELLQAARAQEMTRLELETFSALTVAARMYRRAGFRVTWERERSDWGPTILYQHYELELDPGAAL